MKQVVLSQALRGKLNASILILRLTWDIVIVCWPTQLSIIEVCVWRASGRLLELSYFTIGSDWRTPSHFVAKQKIEWCVILIFFLGYAWSRLFCDAKANALFLFEVEIFVTKSFNQTFTGWYNPKTYGWKLTQVWVPSGMTPLLGHFDQESKSKWPVKNIPDKTNFLRCDIAWKIFQSFSISNVALLLIMLVFYFWL